MTQKEFKSKFIKVVDAVKKKAWDPEQKKMIKRSDDSHDSPRWPTMGYVCEECGWACSGGEEGDLYMVKDKAVHMECGAKMLDITIVDLVPNYNLRPKSILEEEENAEKESIN